MAGPFVTMLLTWLARFLPTILTLVGALWTAKEVQDVKDLKDQLVKPGQDIKQFFEGSIDQLVPRGTPGATPDTGEHATFTDVAKDAVNNPASLAWIAVGLLVMPLVIKQIRGFGYNVADATKGVYEEGKTQISGAREQVRHGVRHVQTGARHVKNAHEYIKADPRRRGQ